MAFTNQSTGQFKKKMGIGKKILIGFGALILLTIIINSNQDKDTASSATISTKQEGSISSSNDNESIIQPVAQEQEENAIKEKLKIKAKREWPDDYTTQEFWVNEQIEAYKYMKTIPDGSIKRKAEHDWPLDFSTQKFWYNEQIEAKERLK